MIDLVIDDGIAIDIDAEIIEKAIETTCLVAKNIKNPSLCTRFANNEAVQQLNSEWRNQDKVTDVLSFPMQDDELDATESLGDIILAMPFVAQEATRLDLLTSHHILHLIVHGTLHLLGYDHIDDADAQEMQGLENQIMQRLELHKPYPTLGTDE
ncbi:MAG TPA: rRNA maturation RNase YbeY [Ghiorsea sp.]|nr:rRNA maturation RNase YbeY [Ghiorsea sp.]HIP06949.1 rRNA maturation RNase YbeY [Mariprofundaceae bacterium]